MQVEDGKLVAIVGQVGSGKSSLISSLLGDMEKNNGYVKVRVRSHTHDIVICKRVFQKSLYNF